MKTAVSLPDELFRTAEAAAKQLRISRSQLYATAISEFLTNRHADQITQRLNEVYSTSGSKLDPVLHRAQMQSVKRERW